MPPNAIRLVAPARHESLAVVRSVAAGAANRMGLGYDRVEEARLGVSEAASLLIRDGASSSLHCELSDGPGLEVTLGADPGPALWPPKDWANSLEHLVLMTVTDWFEISNEARPELRLSFGGIP